MIIDFRVRPPYKSFLGTHLYNRRDPDPDPVTVNGLMIDMPRYRSFDERSLDAFLAELDEAGVDVAVVVGRVAPAPFNGVSNDDVRELLEAHPHRFVGFGAVDVTQAAAATEIARLASLGFKGISFDNPWCVPPRYDDDEALFPLYQLCEESGLIGMFTSSIFVGPDLSYSDPVHIQRVARQFPRWPMVIAHGCWPWVTQVCGVAFQNPNVYLMPDLYVNAALTPGADEYVNAANYFLSYRLLYASSYPVRPVGESLQRFRSLAFASEEIRARCVGGNAARLLGIKE